EKTALLVRGKLGAILDSSKADETFNLRLRLLEDEMSRLIDQVCPRLQITRREFTLLRLAEEAEPAMAEEIRALVTLFKNLVDQLKIVNQRNIKLIESSLHFSRGVIDFIANATTSYQSTGTLKPCAMLQNTISSRA
ncbi:MAG: flagellar protein FlgN, partial [Acidobacteria bacterium]|nr:flagellar protein FlgN [Acidobacteriota bacterium]